MADEMETSAGNDTQPEASTETSNKDGKETSESTSDAGSDKTFTQEELNSILAETKRGLRSENEDLKTKAAEYDKIVEANKTELERATERAEQAEKRVLEANQSALRSRIQAEYNIPAKHAVILTGSDEEELTAQAQAYDEGRTDGAENSNKPRPPKPDPNQGRSNAGATTTADQFAAVFGSALNR